MTTPDVIAESYCPCRGPRARGVACEQAATIGAENMGRMVAREPGAVGPSIWMTLRMLENCGPCYARLTVAFWRGCFVPFGWTGPSVRTESAGKRDAEFRYGLARAVEERRR